MHIIVLGVAHLRVFQISETLPFFLNRIICLYGHAPCGTTEPQVGAPHSLCT